MTQLVPLTSNQLHFMHAIFLCTDFEEVNWNEIRRISGQASVAACKKKQRDLLNRVAELAYSVDVEGSKPTTMAAAAGNRHAPVRRSQRVAEKEGLEEAWSMEANFGSLSIEH